jgi:hypothetical protein
VSEQRSQRTGVRRYVSAIVVVAVVALVAVSGVVADHQYRDSKLVAINELRGRVVLASTVFDAYFAGDLATLDALAKSEPVIRGDQGAMLAYFRRVAPPGNTTFTGGVAWINAKGISRVSSTYPRLVRPINVTDRSYYRRAIATNAPFISEGLVSRRTRNRVIVLAVPTHDAKGKINGALTGALQIKASRTSESAIQLGFTGVEILDRADQSLVNGFSKPPNQGLLRRMRQASTGTLANTRGLKGSTGDVVVWASTPVAGWKIAIDRRRSDVFAAARRALVLNVAMLGGLALLVLLLIGWLLQRSQHHSRSQLRELEREHEISVRLQRSMLPAELPAIPGLDISARYRAAVAGTEAGGDFYDVITAEAGVVHAIVGDVGGRGIGAAALMGQLRSSFLAHGYEHVSPSEIVRRMARVMPDRTMATVLCISLDPTTGSLLYVSAGHPPALVLDPSTGDVTPLDVVSGPPLGFSTDPQLRDTAAIAPTGATIVAYTDGLVERRTESIDDGIEHVASALKGGDAKDSADEIAERILHAVGDSSGGDGDDIALLVISFDDAGSAEASGHRDRQK